MIIAIATIVNIRREEMGFASIRGKAQSLVSGLADKLEAGGAVIDSAEVKLLMRTRELTIGEQESGIVCDRLIEQTNCVVGLLYPAGVEGRRFKKLLATEIAIIGDNVRCRCLLDRRFLRWCKLGLKLVRHGFGNLALDRENIIQWTMVVICPKVSVASGVDQLRTDTHAISCALDASLQDVRNA